MACGGSTIIRSESGLWWLAHQAILDHGLEAPGYAADSAERLLLRGEIERAHLRRIVHRRAAILLQRTTRAVN